MKNDGGSEGECLVNGGKGREGESKQKRRKLSREEGNGSNKTTEKEQED